MKVVKSILALLMTGAMIIAAGCNKEENGGKKENLPHPNSTYKACPILAHFGNEKLGIKEINRGGCVYRYDEEGRLIQDKRDSVRYEYDKQGRLISIKYGINEYTIGYDAYSFIDSICMMRGETMVQCRTFRYSRDVVYVTDLWCELYHKEEYVLKFSEDLYLTYKAIGPNHSFGAGWWRYEWKDGNLTSWCDDGGGKKEYRYDYSPAIDRLTEGWAWGLSGNYLAMSKNNRMEENIKYTYNNKGLVETITRPRTNGEEWMTPVSYTYY